MIDFIILMSIVVCFSAILALGLNFQWGLGGMVNFGLAGFYALGAYTCAILMTKAGFNTFFGALGAMAITAALCGLVAFVTLRVTEEDYFAIVTLGVGEMLRLVALNEDWLTGGALGITGIPRPLNDVIAAPNYPYFMLALCVVIVAACVWFLNRLARSPFGRVMRAVREDDVVAATLGKNVLWARVRIFAIGGALMGLGGALHAFYYRYIDPTQFTNILIAYAFMAVIAGGRGAHIGAVAGAAVVMLLLEGSRFVKELVPGLEADQLAAVRVIMIGVALIALLIYRPQGFLREYRLQVPLGGARPGPRSNEPSHPPSQTQNHKEATT
jgi:ABC-type branched-subunit amino acid transport system permease subunit